MLLSKHVHMFVHGCMGFSHSPSWFLCVCLCKYIKMWFKKDRFQRNKKNALKPLYGGFNFDDIIYTCTMLSGSGSWTQQEAKTSLTLPAIKQRNL